MDPREFLAFADRVISGPDPGPAGCRTVISRSYYAVFNVAVGMIEELGIPLDKAKESHKEVMDLIEQGKDHKLKEACIILANQKRTRVHADYYMNDPDVENVQKASRALLLARQAIEIVDRVRGNPDVWRNAADNIIAYARDVQKKVM